MQVGLTSLIPNFRDSGYEKLQTPDMSGEKSGELFGASAGVEDNSSILQAYTTTSTKISEESGLLGAIQGSVQELASDYNASATDVKFSETVYDNATAKSAKIGDMIQSISDTIQTAQSGIVNYNNLISSSDTAISNLSNQISNIDGMIANNQAVIDGHNAQEAVVKANQQNMSANYSSALTNVNNISLQIGEKTASIANLDQMIAALDAPAATTTSAVDPVTGQAVEQPAAEATPTVSREQLIQQRDALQAELAQLNKNLEDNQKVINEYNALDDGLESEDYMRVIEGNISALQAQKQNLFGAQDQENSKKEQYESSKTFLGENLAAAFDALDAQNDRLDEASKEEARALSTLNKQKADQDGLELNWINNLRNYTNQDNNIQRSERELSGQYNLLRSMSQKHRANRK